MNCTASGARMGAGREGALGRLALADGKTEHLHLAIKASYRTDPAKSRTLLQRRQQHPRPRPDPQKRDGEAPGTTGAGLRWKSGWGPAGARSGALGLRRAAAQGSRPPAGRRLLPSAAPAGSGPAAEDKLGSAGRAGVQEPPRGPAPAAAALSFLF